MRRWQALWWRNRAVPYDDPEVIHGYKGARTLAFRCMTLSHRNIEMKRSDNESDSFGKQHLTHSFVSKLI